MNLSYVFIIVQNGMSEIYVHCQISDFFYTSENNSVICKYISAIDILQNYFPTFDFQLKHNIFKYFDPAKVKKERKLLYGIRPVASISTIIFCSAVPIMSV